MACVFLIQVNTPAIIDVVATANLPEPGDAGPAARIIVKSRPIPPYFLTHDGTRAHQTHLAHEDVEELRQLVEAGKTQDVADARDPRIGPELEIAVPFGARGRVGSEDSGQHLVSVRHHGAEFPADKRFAVCADPFVTEECRTAIEPHESGDDKHWNRQDEEQRGS